MMQDPIEDKQFENLLSDYAAPVDDDGFSARVMAQLPRDQSPVVARAHLRRAYVGGGAILGGVIAATQIPALAKILSKVQLPDISAPALGSVDTSMLLTPYGLAAITLAALGGVWLSASLLFGDQM